MRFLLQSKGNNLSKEVLLARVWGFDSNAVGEPRRGLRRLPPQKSWPPSAPMSALRPCAASATIWRWRTYAETASHPVHRHHHGAADAPARERDRPDLPFYAAEPREREPRHDGLARRQPVPAGPARTRHRTASTSPTVCPGQQIRRDSRHQRRLLRPLGRRFPAGADRRHLFLHRHAGRNSAISPPLQPLSAAERAAPRLRRHHERTGHAPRPAPQQSPARRCCAFAVLRRELAARSPDRSAGRSRVAATKAIRCRRLARTENAADRHHDKCRAARKPGLPAGVKRSSPPTFSPCRIRCAAWSRAF